MPRTRGGGVVGRVVGAGSGVGVELNMSVVCAELPVHEARAAAVMTTAAAMATREPRVLLPLVRKGDLSDWTD